jgi:hypothetical protein
MDGSSISPSASLVTKRRQKVSFISTDLANRNTILKRLVEPNILCLKAYTISTNNAVRQGNMALKGYTFTKVPSII